MPDKILREMRSRVRAGRLAMSIHAAEEVAELGKRNTVIITTCGLLRWFLIIVAGKPSGIHLMRKGFTSHCADRANCFALLLVTGHITQ